MCDSAECPVLVFAVLSRVKPRRSCLVEAQAEGVCGPLEMVYGFDLIRGFAPASG